MRPSEIANIINGLNIISYFIILLSIIFYFFNIPHGRIILYWISKYIFQNDRWLETNFEIFKGQNFKMY